MSFNRKFAIDWVINPYVDWMCYYYDGNIENSEDKLESLLDQHFENIIVVKTYNYGRDSFKVYQGKRFVMKLTYQILQTVDDVYLVSLSANFLTDLYNVFKKLYVKDSKLVTFNNPSHEVAYIRNYHPDMSSLVINRNQ